MFRALEARTRDGSPYRIRAIAGADADRERAFIAALSEQSRRNRFFFTMRDATPELIEAFVNIDPRRAMALVATLPTMDGEPIIGVARYALDADCATRAEFAVTVADAWQGRGVGRRLLEELIACARTRGLRTLYASMLASNAPMIRLARELGMRTSAAHADAPLIEARLELSASGSRSAGEA